MITRCRSIAGRGCGPTHAASILTGGLHARSRGPAQRVRARFRFPSSTGHSVRLQLRSALPRDYAREAKHRAARALGHPSESAVGIARARRVLGEAGILRCSHGGGGNCPSARRSSRVVTGRARDEGQCEDAGLLHVRKMMQVSQCAGQSSPLRTAPRAVLATNPIRTDEIWRNSRRATRGNRGGARQVRGLRGRVPANANCGRPISNSTKGPLTARRRAHLTDR